MRYMRPFTTNVVTTARIVGPSDYGGIVGPSDVRRMALRGAPEQDIQKPLVTFIALLAVGTAAVVAWSFSK